LPVTEPQHTWADLLTLLGAIRRIAYLPSYTMDCDEQMRQIRDLSTTSTTRRPTTPDPRDTTARPHGEGAGRLRTPRSAG
jgi:hypothetical protein